MATDQQSLEQRLEQLLDVESFDPPEEFVSQALIKEYKQPRRSGRVLGRAGRGARLVRAVGPPCSTTPTRRSTSGSRGRLNVSHNCLDRHVEAGIGDRVAFHWHGDGRRDPRHHAMPICTAYVSVSRQRAEGQGREARDVVGIFLR